MPPDPKSCLLLLLLLLLVLGSSTAGAAASNGTGASSQLCAPFRCGNWSSDINITYPFWLEEPRDASLSYCGYEGLGLICSNGKPTLRTRKANYTVLKINTTTRTVSLVDARLLLLTGDSICPSPPHNVSSDLFYAMEFAESDANITFHLSCTIDYTVDPGNYTLCLSDPLNPMARKYSYVLAPGDPPPSSLSILECKETAVVPVKKSLIPATAAERGPIWFAAALTQGFDMRWHQSLMKDCKDCEQRGGQCSYNNYTGGLVFDCHCSDGPQHRNCSASAARNGPPEKSTKNKNKNWKIIVAAVAAPSALVVVLMLVLIFYRRRYETKRSGSLSKLMRSASSESYSTEKDVEGLSSLTHKFTYGELEEATEGFKESNELGDGGFGTVYKGKLRDGRVVAVKRLYENNFKRAEQFINEVAILNRLRHKNLVSLYGCTSRHSRGLLLVYEYVPNGTVADHLHGPRVEEGALTWPVRMSIAMETAGALAYLHAVEPPIIHRDIKTNNILLDENFHVKVADFGLSRLFPPDATHVSTVPQGTPGYLDPEYHQCYQLTDKSDVYSFGVVLAELISSKPAVDISRKRNEINLANLAISRIQNCRLQELVDPLLGYDSDDVVRNMIGQVAELAFRCLQAEKEMRPSMEEVVEVLKGITGATGPGREHSRGKVERDVKKNTEDCSLLNDSVQYSPDTVHEQWVSTKTTPNTSGQASM